MVLALSGTMLAFAALPALAEGAGPESRAREFWAALKVDREAAQAMVEPDAKIGIGDVGGPLELSALEELRSNCELGPEAAVKPLAMEGRAIVVVEMKLACTMDGETRPLLADFMVEDDKIAGLYLHGDGQADDGVSN